MTCILLKRSAKPANWLHRLCCPECRRAYHVDRLIARGFVQMRSQSLPMDGLGETLSTLGLTNRTRRGRVGSRRLMLGILAAALIAGACLAAQLMRVFVDEESAGATGAFSPDGKLLATASQGLASPYVKVWDVQGGSVKWKQPLAQGPLRCGAFSPDGNYLAVCGGGLNEPPLGIFMLNAENGALERTIPCPIDIVWTVSFSADGNLLASGNRDGTVRLWDPRSGELRRTLKADVPPIVTGEIDYGVQRVLFSPDGKLIAGGSPNDGMIRMWDVNTGELKVRVNAKGHGFRFDFSPDGKLLGTGHYDGSVRIWNAQTAKLEKTILGHAGAVGSVLFSPNGDWLATASTWEDAAATRTQDDPPLKGELRLWDARTGQLKRNLEDRCWPIQALAFAPDSKTLASMHQMITTGAPIKLWPIE